jgi:glycosyltransferase involved in cell wall biosynthesis
MHPKLGDGVTVSESRASRGELVVLTPVYNDWTAVRLLLPLLDAELAKNGLSARVVLIDDASFEPMPERLTDRELDAITEIRVLTLRRNLGHQRALAIGLSYVQERVPCEAVVVMDADGEDAPADVPRLVAEMAAREGRMIVFAQRIRRSEGFVFTFLYKLYRYAHLMLTGISVQVGNFSVIPRALLDRLVVVSDLWNHYAAAVFHSRLPYAMLPTPRARRLAGKSSMNLVALVGHGLSAIAVFADRVGVRVLIASIVAFCATLLVIAAALGRWVLTGHAPPIWLPIVAGVVVLVVLQAGVAASLFVLHVLSTRAGSTFIPARDYRFFIHSDELVTGHARASV